MEARSLDPWILASALVKLSSPGAGLFPVGQRRARLSERQPAAPRNSITPFGTREARMALPEFPVEGGCQCGAVRYRLKASPLTVYNCHCKDCQRFSGAAWSMSMIVRDEDFEVLSGQTVRYDRKANSGKHGLGRAGRKHLDGQQGRLGEDRPGTGQFPERRGGPDAVVRRLDPAQSELKNEH